VTSVIDRAGSAAGGGRTSAGKFLPAPARMRRPLRTISSLMLVVCSIAVFVGIYERANHRVPILVVVRTVQFGERLTASDLGEASAAVGGPVASVPYADLGAVVGRRAAVGLVPGALLTPDDLTNSRPIPGGDAIVGVALKSDQLPPSGVSSGDRVMVIETDTSGGGTTSPNPVGGGGVSTSGGGSGPGVLVPDAIVYETVAPPPGSSGNFVELVSLEVPATVAPQVSEAAAQDQLSLVILPPSGGGA